MGIVTTTVLLRNARVPTLALQVEAVADTGSLFLCIPSMFAIGYGSKS